MVVYADVLFLVNFVSSYIMLYILGKIILKTKIKKWRLCTASAVGAFFAILMFSMEISPLVSCIMRLISAFTMVITAFYEQKRRFLRHFAWLMLLSMMAVAAMMFISAMIAGTTGAVVKNGIAYLDIPMTVFLPSLILSYAVIAFAASLMDRRKAKKLYAVTITRDGKKIAVTALFDSGNLLREPISGKSVSLLEWEDAKILLGADFENCDIAEYAAQIGLRAVPFQSVGNKSGIIFAFVADSLCIVDERKTFEKIFIGIFDGKLSKNNEYSALLSAALI